MVVTSDSDGVIMGTQTYERSELRAMKTTA